MQDANKHITISRFVLDVFGKKEDSVMALRGDNCAVNCAINNKVKISYVECTSHRFQLAVKDVMAEE